MHQRPAAPRYLISVRGVGHRFDGRSRCGRST